VWCQGHVCVKEEGEEEGAQWYGHGRAYERAGAGIGT